MWHQEADGKILSKGNISGISEGCAHEKDVSPSVALAGYDDKCCDAFYLAQEVAGLHGESSSQQGA